MRRRDSKHGFESYFDPGSGRYVRTGVLDRQGRDTGIDPFMADFPELLDVGIVGHCVHGLSGRCAAAGVGCYQSGGSVYQDNMTLDDFRRIVGECRGRTFQFALGGRGDPELHDDFEEMVACCRDNGIVPNMTTSGFLLTRDNAAVIKRYCGAAAVSWYGTPYTRRAIEILLEAGVKTNIHYVLGRDTIDDAIDLLSRTGEIPNGVNRVIFLLFKPVGQGSPQNVLRPDDERVSRFFGLLDTTRGLEMAGFDSCCVPGLVNHTEVVDRRAFDTCEGARFSAYVTPDMKMLPCSFDQDFGWTVDLRETSIEAGWESQEFEDFRARLRGACPGCATRSLCMGGCPIRPEIVLCPEAAAQRAGIRARK